MGKFKFIWRFLGRKILQNLDIACFCFVALPLMERIKLKTNPLFNPIWTIWICLLIPFSMSAVYLGKNAELIDCH